MAGKIRKAVREEYFSRYPNHKTFINAFLNHFNVNWAKTVSSHNTDISVFLLEPLSRMKEDYGFDREVVLAYSNYDQMQPRAVQAIEEFMNQDPAKGRVDPIVVFLISNDPDVAQWVDKYVAEYKETRIIIPFYKADVVEHKNDYWYIRNIITEHLYSRDLFDYKLPLKHDLFYFGRDSLLSSFLETVNKRENIGLFGLRKTGKTSFLYKLQRQLSKDEYIKVLYYDCKSPAIRMKNWNELLEYIGNDLINQLELAHPLQWDVKHSTDSFQKIVSHYKQYKYNILLIFDEIEYISPLAIEDTHWHKGYIPFWQSIWTIQSSLRNLSFIVAGVNSEVIEKSEYYGIQNPLFGIVKQKYLTGLSKDEVISMLEIIGKRMGIKFDHDAKQYIYERYGGHPYITRLACSMINTRISAKKEQRPVRISRKRLIHEENDREEDLAHYSRHIISELEKFYPDEYTMLEMLALGQIGDFIEYDISDFTTHIKKYGLVVYDSGKPKFSIPAIRKYIATEAARKEKVVSPSEAIAKMDKAYWVKKRMKLIINDMDHLNRIISEKDLPRIYGINSLPYTDKLMMIEPTITEDQFTAFISLMYKSFIESIRNNGQTLDAIQEEYPAIRESFERVILFRHRYSHQKLRPDYAKKYEEMIRKDYPDKIPHTVKYFIYQYRILDELFVSIQIETQRIEN